MIARHLLVLFVALSSAGAELSNPWPAYEAEKAQQRQALEKAVDAAISAVTCEEKEAGLEPAAATRERRALEEVRASDGARVPAVRSLSARPTAEELKVEARLTEIWRPVLALVEPKKAAVRTRCTKLQDDTYAYAMECFTKSTTAEEITPVLEVVRVVKAETFPALVPFPNHSVRLEGMEQLLATAEALLQAYAAHDLPTMQWRLSKLNHPAREAVTDWQRRLGARVQEHRQSLKIKELSALLEAGAPAEKLEAFADELTFAIGAAKLFEPPYKSPSSFGLTTWLNALERWEADFARACAKVRQARDAGNLREAQQLARALGAFPKTLTPGAVAAVEKMREGIGRELQASEAAARAELDARVHAALAEANEPEAILRFASTLETESAATPHPALGEQIRGLAGQLRQVAACMASADADARGLLRPSTSLANAGSSVGAADLQALRQRVGRAWLARRSESPEFLQPPLASTPLNDAIAQLTRTLFEQRAWPRLLKVLSARESAFGNLQRGGEPEELRGVRVLITAQNLENAEQYVEAARSYKEVLGCIGDLVPTDAAAERLKPLKKEHPEAFVKAPAH